MTKDTQITLESLKLSVTFFGPRRIKKDGNWDCHKWVAVFTRGNRSEPFDYYTGIGLKAKTPNPIEILACISKDYLSTCHVAYEDWAGEFGYDKDSRKGEAIYRLCRSTGLRLLNLILVSEMDALSQLEF